MIKNIVFDIGNVLLEFQPKKYFAKMFNDEKFAHEICHLMMNSQIWKDYDLGHYSMADVRVAFQKELPQYHDEIRQMLDVWVKILEPKDYTLEKMLLLKRRGYQIYLLSNLNKEAYDYIKKRYCIFEEADGYIVSFQEKMAKPNQEIYELLCERYHLNPKECVFLDDLHENVDAAIQYGMNAIHFINDQQVEDELEMILMESVC